MRSLTIGSPEEEEYGKQLHYMGRLTFEILLRVAPTRVHRLLVSLRRVRGQKDSAVHLS